MVSVFVDNNSYMILNDTVCDVDIVVTDVSSGCIVTIIVTMIHQ